MKTTRFNPRIMIVHVASLLLASLLAGMIAFADADAADAAVYERYCGTWTTDGNVLEFKYGEDGMTGMLIWFREPDVRVIWDFTACRYEPDSDILWCIGCTHYVERYGPKTDERTEEDWWLSDLSDIYFALGDDADTLIGYDIEDIGEPLVLRRFLPEFGF